MNRVSGRTDAPAGTKSNGPLAVLQKTTSPARRRVLIVLLVSLPLWVYATTWDLLVMLFQSALGQNGVGVVEIIERILIRLPLLPMLVGAYLIAVNVSWQPRKRALFAATQVGIALVFSALTRPILVASYYTTSSAFGTHVEIRKLLHDLMPWQYWAATTIQYTIVYALGLVLIFTVNVFLRLKHEQLKAAQLRSKWLEAKLATLRGQLDPHFFFNALNVVVALIHRDPDRAERLLTELGALLRRSLANGSQQFSTVRDELQFVERYLAIMKARYERRLTTALRVDPDILDFGLPAFLLVPLVENAVKHGVAAQPGADTVAIVGFRDGEYLTFSVTNGNRGHSHGPAKESTGVGLGNTRRRLMAIYGPRHRFRSAPDATGRWVATVSVPAEAVARAEEGGARPGNLSHAELSEAT